MANSHTGNVQPSIDLEEHVSKGQLMAKRVVPYSYDATTDTLSPLGGNLINASYDYVGVDKSGSATDVYTFRSGGSGGTLVATVTITYTDSTKGTQQSVAKT